MAPRAKKPRRSAAWSVRRYEDWVIRFNDEGPQGLSNKPSRGAPGKLGAEHKEFLARLIDKGPIPAIDGVVRWRACDLVKQLYAQFGLSVSDATVYRALKELGFAWSARPKPTGKIRRTWKRLKKFRRARGGGPRGTRAGYTGRGVVPR